MLLQLLPVLLATACGGQLCVADGHSSRHHRHHHQYGSNSNGTTANNNNINEIDGIVNVNADSAATTKAIAMDDATKPFADCDYFQNLLADKSYDIYSPGYMENVKASDNRRYAPDTQCRWIAQAPEGHTIRLQCVDVALPMVRVCVCIIETIALSGQSPLISRCFCACVFVCNCSSHVHIVRFCTELRLPSRSAGN